MRPASDVEKERLGETFAALCAISSPFGHERECADWIRAELESIGLDVTEDGAAQAAGAECGNLLARLPSARSERSVLLCGHMDTVPDLPPITPEVVDGFWVNTSEGILGADNKAALAVMIEVARRVRAETAPIGLELLFTVSEENALAGAKRFDVEALRSDYGYVFDQATSIGEIVVASPTYFRIAADFHGQPAHAGVRPEAGRSAILAATHAIGRMPHGRLDAETTANVGFIHSGTPSATNVVPARCSLLAEARSIDPDKVEAVVADMVDALHDGAAAAECDVDVTVEKLFTGYRFGPNEPAVLVAEAALAATGFEPRRIVTGGGADGNAFIAKGFPCVCLANGTERNHQADERVSVSALEAMLDVALAVLDAAAEREPAPPSVAA